MISELARLDVRDLAGVYAARQLVAGGRQLGPGPQDQIRWPPLISESRPQHGDAGRTAVITFGSTHRPAADRGVRRERAAEGIAAPAV